MNFIKTRYFTSLSVFEKCNVRNLISFNLFYKHRLILSRREINFEETFVINRERNRGENNDNVREVKKYFIEFFFLKVTTKIMFDSIYHEHSETV